MTTSTERGQRTSSESRVSGRVRSALWTRGQRSHPARPQTDAHRLFRLQPPPFV
jgi:hypothetical protein